MEIQIIIIYDVVRRLFISVAAPAAAAFHTT
ncbi:hypothetical protein N234_30105 [Ralstonia pickettii DTP0602]|nr:hypothetical protein N234_30105 [Ralstonia pickettii DTP0602]